MKNIFLSGSLLFILSAFSLNILTAQHHLIDAAFIQFDPKLGKVVYHRVHDQQTLYAIARGYGVSGEGIIKANPMLKNNRSITGLVLKIPIADDQIVVRLPLFRNKQEFLPVYYQVAKKDNLFRVSRVYFNIPTNLLVSRNHIEGEQLQEGQTLHIGWLKRSYEPLIVHTGKIIDPSKRDNEAIGGPISDLAIRFQNEYEGTHLVNKNEVAMWKSTENTRGFFVMHRHAAQQSIIEIKNPMFDVTVYAKVIGTIPDHLYPREVDMIISKDVAQALRAIDPRFFVRSRYKSAMISASR
jgi:LysM repeat protein